MPKYRLKINKNGKMQYAKSNKGDILDFDSKVDAAKMARVFKSKKISIIKK